MSKNFQERYPVASLTVVMIAITMGLAWLLGKMWKYTWFRYTFVVFMVVLLLKIIMYTHIWNSFAPRVEMNNFIAATVEYNHPDLIITNTSNRYWLERVDVKCTLQYKNGTNAGSIVESFPLNYAGSSWLPPGGQHTYKASKFYSFFNHNTVIKGPYSNVPTKCDITNAQYREIINHDLYRISYKIEGANHITAQLYNVHVNKKIVAIEASCYNGDRHLFVELIPSDGSHTPPGKWGMYRNKSGSIFKQAVQCTTIRVRYWDY